MGLTKLDLARYMVDVGDAFMAANGGRPVTLQRFKDTVDGDQFFSKNPPKGAPDFVRCGRRRLSQRTPASPAGH